MKIKKIIKKKIDYLPKSKVKNSDNNHNNNINNIINNKNFINKNKQ